MRQPSPEKRRTSPATELIPIAKPIVIHDKDTSDQDRNATAARHLARRFMVRIAIAKIIAVELGMAGAS